MALTPGNIDAVLIATTTNAVLQAGASSLVLTKVTACNTDTDARKVSVWRVPNGGSVASGELLWDAQPVAAGATVVLPFSGKSLVAMQQLFASANVAGVVTLSIDYVQPS